MAYVPFDTWHLSLPHHVTGAFQAAILVPELRGCESEEVNMCVGFLRGTALGSSSVFHQLNPHGFLQPEVVGTYLPGTGNLGLGGLVWGWDSSLPRYHF